MSMCYLLVYYKQKHRNIQFTRRWITNRNILFFFFLESGKVTILLRCLPASLLYRRKFWPAQLQRDFSDLKSCLQSVLAAPAKQLSVRCDLCWAGLFSGVAAVQASLLPWVTPYTFLLITPIKNAVTSQLGLQCGHYFGLSWVPFLGICVCCCCS